MPTYPYRSNKQIERFLGQFMRAISGFQVRDGVMRNGSDNMRRVPVVYQSMSRIASNIMNNRDGFSGGSLPIIGVVLTGITLDKEKRRSNKHEQYTLARPIGGNDEMVTTLFGPPILMEVEASVFASSKSELYEIIEQMLLVFNPRLSLLLKDEKFDPNYITEITLTTVGDEINIPISTESAMNICNLTFEIPVSIYYPHKRSETFIKEIIANIKTDDSDFVITSEVITIDE